MRYACWITNDKNIHSEDGPFTFHRNNGYANAPQRYVYTHNACIASSQKRMEKFYEKFGLDIYEKMTS